MTDWIIPKELAKISDRLNDILEYLKALCPQIKPKPVPLSVDDILKTNYDGEVWPGASNPLTHLDVRESSKTELISKDTAPNSTPNSISINLTGYELHRLLLRLEYIMKIKGVSLDTGMTQHLWQKISEQCNCVERK